jgi:hypothetical protein
MILLLIVAALLLQNYLYQHNHNYKKMLDEALKASPGQLAYDHVLALAGPEYEGRAPGTRGCDLAARYIAGQFQKLGLKPAGDGGTYFQAIRGPQFSLVREGNRWVPHLTGIFLTVPGNNVLGYLPSRETAQSAASQSAGSQEGSSQGATSQGVASQEGSSQGAASQGAASQGAGLPGGVSPNPVPQDDGSQNSGTWNVVSPNPASQDAGIQNPAPQNGIQNTDTRSSGAQNAVPSSAAFPENTLIVSAHYDHLGQSGGSYFPGANDNASGIGVMLETARILAGRQQQPKMNILFAAWTSEEEGLYGSRLFTAKVPTGGIKAVLNIDTVGNGDVHDFRLWTQNQDNPLVYVIEDAGSQQGLHIDTEVLNSSSPHTSDHKSFAELGIPSVTLLTPTWLDHNHTLQDTPALVNPAKLDNAVKLVVATIDRIAY